MVLSRRDPFGAMENLERIIQAKKLFVSGKIFFFDPKVYKPVKILLASAINFEINSLRTKIKFYKEH